MPFKSCPRKMQTEKKDPQIFCSIFHQRSSFRLGSKADHRQLVLQREVGIFSALEGITGISDGHERLSLPRHQRNRSADVVARRHFYCRFFRTSTHWQYAAWPQALWMLQS